MGLFDFLKPKGKSYITTDVNEQELRLLIIQAIASLENSKGLDSNGIINVINIACRNEELALALYRFIPVAYCRIFIPEPAYSDEYIVVRSENDRASFLFSKDRIYAKVLDECRKHLAGPEAQQNALNVLRHSADFDAINNALNGGANIKNLVCSPSYFM